MVQKQMLGASWEPLGLERDSKSFAWLLEIENGLKSAAWEPLGLGRGSKSAA